MTHSEIAVVGGVYHEHCIWPEWDQIFGSGGRAAAALVSHIDKVTLYTYVRSDIETEFKTAATLYKFNLVAVPTQTAISFDYVHCMSPPVIRPVLSRIPAHAPIQVSADAVLRFGMLEGSGKVSAKWCVYDPQSAFHPEPFWDNGSQAEHLAIVANRSEITAMAKNSDPKTAATRLLERGAEVIVVKSGPAGAYVYTAAGAEEHIPAYRSPTVWTLGSGDVFAAIFAAQWAIHRASPTVAAEFASRAVSQYAETMSLPAVPAQTLSEIPNKPAATVSGKVYLASPFFNLGQRWLVDEARHCLTELGLTVFSPVHDIGRGPAHDVAPKDIYALNSCDRVFAILDGLDAGTVFEVGYARAKSIPVYALAQAVNWEDLKMVVGSDCKMYLDFVTALHHTAWKA
ncbi:PfkB family carbohydrate kinase [Burkholderia oklahomensis]|uniref:PfkB family carbohydrate kinase n=1 Tax=Burkholderia oklahomensis TaxID=342113 RepID=UPI00016A8702|nr:PfkB family carbohydrate kinase [Burkholderia oklahomensis]AJX30447.1 nucleoside 2-deoxyribosyltransferase family protein [Burkholderia oklahomensis C6786]AOI46368.1 nucleoside 2-deoxyribosyltransferase [Burkholderia oklahomensis C6786]KUY56187.1 nucleoside 2-deoxyribosyltransferase [Burkholderia oklahomensis C6786]MBI0361033.1 nucleoside 2-deoxyribosyltransferase [Burkholderia oklahomensis]SUW60410.1 ribokinase [Burkholderia oklahomensis]